MTAAEYQAYIGKKPATAPKAAQATTGPPATPKPATAPPIGRNTAPIAPAPVPLRWEVARGLFAEQHPGAFRLVVVGSEAELPQVLEKLRELLK
ncbi:hypothetical protein BEN47_16690 [Hymenobacter lapidarius]|uniref:Uncharacterized protein n=1 Tax=Hymenobacter lapidarius TaxID=1908237 RepID=A0A1G1SZR5_9BACT|nr:hypothetical protein [Hymenobacter lapidarius]OGX84114.1 hypothetical protein BEN47_16690 [Hymenobacter lapidarius]